MQGDRLTIDRIQLAVRDRVEAARVWKNLLDACVVRKDEVKCLGCRRTVLAVGTSEVPFHAGGPAGGE